MRFCMPHWNALREAVKARGLDHLVARSGEEIFSKTINELEGKEPVPDPLMSAHNMIVGNAMKVSGLEILYNNEDGSERCPICYLNAPDWIDKAADGVKEYFDKREENDPVN